MVSTTDSKSVSQGSNPCSSATSKYHKRPIAQRLEQCAHNTLVTGSNPVGPTKSFVNVKEDKDES